MSARAETVEQEGRLSTKSIIYMFHTGAYSFFIVGGRSLGGRVGVATILPLFQGSKDFSLLVSLSLYWYYPHCPWKFPCQAPYLLPPSPSPLDTPLILHSFLKETGNVQWRYAYTPGCTFPFHLISCDTKGGLWSSKYTFSSFWPILIVQYYNKTNEIWIA